MVEVEKVGIEEVLDQGLDRKWAVGSNQMVHLICSCQIARVVAIEL